MAAVELWVDLNKLCFVAGQYDSTPIERKDYRQRDYLALRIRFVRDGVVQELTAGASAKLGIKSSLDASEYLAAALSWTKSGTGASTYYTVALNLNTAEIAAAITGDGSSVACVTELEWTEGDYVSSTVALPGSITHDINTGAEGAVVSANGIFMIGQYARMVAVTSGVKLQVSTDGSAWQDGPTWIAS